MKGYSAVLVGLAHRKCIVVGGGQVAARKVESLVAAGAVPVVIAPAVVRELEVRAQLGEVTLELRRFRTGDLAGSWLVISATDEPAVNAAVFDEAQAEGCLVNVADDPAHCNFIVPAVVRRGPVSVSASTGGSSPALAHLLRERLEQTVASGWGELAAVLDELRPDLIARFPSSEQRLDFVRHLVADLVDRQEAPISRQEVVDRMS
jgi:precorrin-2 dehydrogenase / sirohydrochlorin ferrochelatase